MIFLLWWIWSKNDIMIITSWSRVWICVHYWRPWYGLWQPVDDCMNFHIKFRWINKHREIFPWKRMPLSWQTGIRHMSDLKTREMEKHNLRNTYSSINYPFIFMILIIFIWFLHFLFSDKISNDNKKWKYLMKTWKNRCKTCPRGHRCPRSANRK